MVIILAVVLIVLLYSYLENNRKLNLSRVRSDASNLGTRVYGEASNLGEKVQGGASDLGEKVSGDSSMSGVSEKFSGVGESISKMGQKIKGKEDETASTDDLTNQIDQYLNEHSNQLIKDWELTTKKDLGELENRYSKVSSDVGKLDKRFKEHREYTNKKINNIEDRLEKLEKISPTTVKYQIK